MRPLTKHPFVDESSPKIKEQVRRLFSAAGVKDKLPTPKEDIIATAKLVEIGALDLADYEERWFGKGLTMLKQAFSKVRGLLDFKENVMHVSPEIHHAQRTFIAYHEVTHRVLSWHEGLYNPHLDTEYSIDRWVATGLDAEANLGASLIQFQIDRFTKELKDLPLGLSSAKYLADRFQTSLHSTFRKYVEDNNQPCALLVLEELSGLIPSGEPILQLWYPLQSIKFTNDFGVKDWDKFYYPGHPIYDIAFSTPSGGFRNGEMQSDDVSGVNRRLRVEEFYNTFNHFVLIYPSGITSSTRKRIVIANSF